MKFTFNKTFFLLFGLLWAVLIVWNLADPKKDFSENENRYLSDFPSFSWETFINGKYMTEVDGYFDDHFILRDNWISLQSILEYSIGKRESNGVFICNDSLIENIGTPDDKTVAQNISGIHYFYEKTQLPSYLMLVPTTCSVQSEKLPLFANAWDQKTFIEDTYSALENITPVPVYQTLYENRHEYIYYRTDHHWTTYGAYLGYVAYCKTLGLTPSEYRSDTVSENFNGTLYSSSGIRFIKSDKMEAFQSDYFAGCSIYNGKTTAVYDSFYFNEYLDKKDKYSYFLGTNQPVVKLFGNNDTGKKLLIFKDSYSNCFSPMLLKDYTELCLVDLRYLNGKLSDYINLSDYNEALFLFNIDTFISENDIAKLKILT